MGCSQGTSSGTQSPYLGTGPGSPSLSLHGLAVEEDISLEAPAASQELCTLNAVNSVLSYSESLFFPNGRRGLAFWLGSGQGVSSCRCSFPHVTTGTVNLLQLRPQDWFPGGGGRRGGGGCRVPPWEFNSKVAVCPGGMKMELNPKFACGPHGRGWDPLLKEQGQLGKECEKSTAWDSAAAYALWPCRWWPR